VRDFVAADDGSLSPEQIVWTEQAYPRVLRTANLIGQAAPAVRLSSLPGVWTGKGGDGHHAVWLASAGTHRLAVAPPVISPDVDAIVLPLDDAFEIRLDAARQFWRSLNGRSSGPAYGALPRQTKFRHVLNLRAQDGRRAGATQRRIAETLLTNEPIASRDWRDHPLRHRVGAILRRADRLVAGGYRDLLFYPLKPSR
jgi:hypothetical protein